jgi:hypothetical protein
MIATGGPTGCGSRSSARAKPLAVRYATQSKFNRATNLLDDRSLPERQMRAGPAIGALFDPLGDLIGPGLGIERNVRREPPLEREAWLNYRADASLSARKWAKQLDCVSGAGRR